MEHQHKKNFSSSIQLQSLTFTLNKKKFSIVPNTVSIPLWYLTIPPNHRVPLSPELTPELRSLPFQTNLLICSGIAYLIFFSPNPVSNSASRISGCFSSCFPRLPYLGIFQVDFCISRIFSSSQLLSTSLGKLDFPQNLIWK